MTTSSGNLPSGGTEEKSRLVDYAGEATGFGETELRTFRDLLLRPRAVLDAYLSAGPTGGGRYARPAGFYVALCGVLMFYLFLVGGLKGIIEQQPAAALDGWIARSGKSREAFIGDADGWMSLVSVPLMSVFYALGAALLLKWWGKRDWRLTLRATFALLCAWTAPILLLGPLPVMKGFEAFAAVAIWGAMIAAFLRMGRGLWWQNWPGGIAKAVLMTVVVMVAGYVGMIPVFGIGLLGGLYGS